MLVIRCVFTCIKYVIGWKNIRMKRILLKEKNNLTKESTNEIKEKYKDTKLGFFQPSFNSISSIESIKPLLPCLYRVDNKVSNDTYTFHQLTLSILQSTQPRDPNETVPSAPPWEFLPSKENSLNAACLRWSPSTSTPYKCPTIT